MIVSTYETVCKSRHSGVVKMFGVKQFTDRRNYTPVQYLGYIFRYERFGRVRWCPMAVVDGLLASKRDAERRFDDYPDLGVVPAYSTRREAIAFLVDANNESSR